MLETYFMDEKKIASYQREPLGPYFDGLAGYLAEKGYKKRSVWRVLQRCRHFSAFLGNREIFTFESINRSLVERFLSIYIPGLKGSGHYKRRAEIDTKCDLNHLFAHLAETGVLQPESPKQVVAWYSWLMDSYSKHLREERQITRSWFRTIRKNLVLFLESLGDRVGPQAIMSLRAEDVEEYIKKHLEGRRHNLRLIASALRGFLRFCFREGHTDVDLSGVFPSIPAYRLSSLPRGMSDPTLKRILRSVSRETPRGSRDYAILLVMMAYGIRGTQTAGLLLEDIQWAQSTIKIRATKGGKEVMLPLLEPVGEAILGYLRHRPKSQLREVFLRNIAPFRSLGGLAISEIVQKYMVKAKVKMPWSGSKTLRHSWAIRALAHDNSIKAIADILGHRYLDTTYIYAKTDLKTLRQVAMPWVEVAL